MKHEILSTASSDVKEKDPTEKDFIALAIKRKLKEATRDLWELSTRIEEGRDELVADIKSFELSVAQLKEKWLEK